MGVIRDELLQEVSRCHPEWPCATSTLPGLERFGGDLIPGLVGCLADSEWEIRHFAICLLVEARPRSDIAVADIIECLDDKNRLVRAAAIFRLDDFGSLAATAIPHLESWLSLEGDDYLWIQAVTLMAKLDPSRTELLVDIRKAATNDNPIVSEIALEFLAKIRETLPFHEENFRQAVRNGWLYGSPCEEVEWEAMCQDDGTWHVDVAPVVQEVWAGKDDDSLIWADFEFHHLYFSEQPGIELESVVTSSRNESNRSSSHICLRGKYFNEPFELRIHMEPQPGSKAREVLNTLVDEVSAIPDNDDATDTDDEGTA